MKKFRFLLLVALFMFFVPCVYAGSFSVSSSDLSPSVGDTIKVTVKANSAAGKFTVSSSNTGVLSGGGSIWVEDGSNSVSFKANSAGSATVTIVPADVSDSSDGSVISGNKTLNITVKAPSSNSSSGNSGSSGSSGRSTVRENNPVKSSINYLSSLSIEGAELSPQFDKDTTEYEVTLESGTSSIKVNGSKESNVSYVTGLGDVSVSEGVNNISVVVTAENGAKRTYNIKATVLEESPIVVNVDGSDKTLIRKNDGMPSASDYYVLSTVKIDDADIPCYVNDTTGYKLVALKSADGQVDLYKYDESSKTYSSYSEFGFSSLRINILDTDAPTDYVVKNITINEKEVKAFVKDGSLPLIYGVNLETGEKNFYSYDSSENTIQKFIISDKEVNYYPFIIVGLSILAFIEFIVICFSGKKKSKKNYEKSFDSSRNTVYNDENNITDDLTDEHMSSEEELGHTALISNSVNNVFDNSVNRKEKKKKKKEKSDDEMFRF